MLLDIALSTHYCESRETLQIPVLSTSHDGGVVKIILSFFQNHGAKTYSGDPTNQNITDSRKWLGLSGHKYHSTPCWIFLFITTSHILTRQDQINSLPSLSSPIFNPSENMGLIKTGLTLAGGYGLIKAASKYVPTLLLRLSCSY